MSGNAKSSLSYPIEVEFHRHRYFEYEKDLAKREIAQIAGISKLVTTPTGFHLFGDVQVDSLRQMAYVAKIHTGLGTIPTFQHELEESYRSVSGNHNRQATRYSAHGLHEYKGKFNPQLARFLLNYLETENTSRILDPFCGSGTTLVESALRGSVALGVDSNPLAVFISNAKLKALTINPDQIESALNAVLKDITRDRLTIKKNSHSTDTRTEYLKKWFPRDTFILLEKLRRAITHHAGEAESILFCLTSNLLREYSLQEPSDLRIRRRTSPMPSLRLIDVLQDQTTSFLRRLRSSQEVTGLLPRKSKAVIADSRLLDRLADNDETDFRRFDAVITSPPYATALPYIDTQRLSLVCLGLISADAIREFEADAIGSREVRRQDGDLDFRIKSNSDNLPAPVADFCMTLLKAVGKSDGFRRKAVPTVIYRYFSDMQQVFKQLPNVLRKGARLGFVVGPSHTTLGGKRFDIKTPETLATIANSLGFRTREVLPLQTYQRYGLHKKNSIQKESLTILELI